MKNDEKASAVRMRKHVLTDKELRKKKVAKVTKVFSDAGKSFYELFKKLGGNSPKSDLEARIAKAKAKRGIAGKSSGQHRQRSAVPNMTIDLGFDKEQREYRGQLNDIRVGARKIRTRRARVLSRRQKLSRSRFG